MITIYNVFMSMFSFVISMAIMTGFELFNVWNISDKMSEDYVQSVLSMAFYMKAFAISSIALMEILVIVLLNNRFCLYG